VVTVDPDKTALVVIDVQNGFVTDNSRHVVPVIADLVDRWMAAASRSSSPATSTTRTRCSTP
jgi:nicotinamidase-related amidase